MSRCDHELTCLCHSLETVSDREAADRTGRVQITDPGNVVVGHDPTERTLTLHVARELPVVPVPVVIQVETVPVRVVRGIEICEDATPFVPTRKVPNQEFAGVQVGDVDALTSSRNRDHTLSQSCAVESCIYFPLSVLLLAPDRRGSKQHARPIAAIEVEGSKAQLEPFAGIALSVDLSLSLPLRNAQRHRQYSLHEPLPFTEHRIPESGYPDVQIVETELRYHSFTKEA